MEITSTQNFPKVNIVKGKRHSLDKTTLKKQVKGNELQIASYLQICRIYVYMSSLDILNQRPVKRDNWWLILKHVIFGCFQSSWLFPQHFHAYFTLQHRTVPSDVIFWATVEWGSSKTPECFSCKAWLEVIISIAASSSSWREQTWDAFQLKKQGFPPLHCKHV